MQSIAGRLAGCGRMSDEAAWPDTDLDGYTPLLANVGSAAEVRYSIAWLRTRRIDSCGSETRSGT